MRRSLLPLAALALVPVLAPADAANPCLDQPTHTYGAAYWAGVESATATLEYHDTEKVTVWDTNVEDCRVRDGVPGDWDGDLDSGVGGAFFGYGSWAEDPDCGYALNVHGPNVAVNDLAFGRDVWFTVAEDDQSGPSKVQDPVTGDVHCLTDGAIRPCLDNLPDQCGPGDDPDDCESVPFQGVGSTCGTGGGDGGYWVILVNYAREFTGGAGVTNPHTSGTITAY